MAQPHVTTAGVVRLSSGRQKQDATTTGESLTVLIEAVEQHAQENDLDSESLLDLLTQQQEALWDLAELLSGMRRDERLDKLYAGLSVLLGFWLEAEGGS